MLSSFLDHLGTYPSSRTSEEQQPPIKEEYQEYRVERELK
jgi:hypothetical protein